MARESNMTEFVKTVSQLVENQFPAFYKEDGPVFVAFVKAYYEFLETTDKYTYKENRELFNSNDIDDTLDEFLGHFKEKYLADFPFVTATDKRFMIKHIMDYYRSKGSKQSLELLMRLLYNEEVEIYYPGEDILKASDSEWYTPVYIEVSKSNRTRGFLNKQIRGSNSGASAFVEGVVTKRVDGKLIDVVYLSSVRGNFSKDERVTDDGVIKNSPKIVGSLTSLTIGNGGRNNIIGDIFDVITDQGRQGKVRVDGIENATGKVDFKIEAGGYGYTNTELSQTATDIYVSDAILYTDNSNTVLDFIRFEPVVQRLETLTLLSATDVNSSAVVGDYLIGQSGADAFVANGYIVSISNTDSEGLTISEPSANSIVVVQVIGDTTFTNQLRIDLDNDKNFIAGEYIEEESELTFAISNATGTFTVGEIVSQTLRDPVTTIVTSYAFATVTATTATSITTDSAWGNWTAEVDITGETSGSVADINSFVTDAQGARAFITAKAAGYIAVREIFGAFTNTKRIRGTRTKLIDTIASTSVTGASDVRLNGVATSNGVIEVVANSYVSGIVVGSNTIAVGVYGNTSPFFYVDTGGVFQLETLRENLISPPRYANGDIIELNKNISGLATGGSADFKIGFLENTETVTINTDMVGANNTANTPFIYVNLDGSNSGIGFVDALYIGSNLTVGSGEADNFILKELVTQSPSGATGTVVYKNDATIRVSDITGTFVTAQDIAGNTSLSAATVSTVTDNGGSAYSNGTVVSFSGGGFVGGDPFTDAVGLIATDGSGTILSITMNDPGEGYYAEPTFDIGSTSGAVANVMLDMDYGYGFVKLSDSDNNTLLVDALTNEDFTIGTIASLTRINPGANYNADPFVVVHNKYIASYQRRNFYMYVSNIAGSFKVGELLTQNIGGSETAKGKVLSYVREGITATIQVERNAFNVAFQKQFPIIGATTNSSAYVETVIDDGSSDSLGDNATISGTVIAANGIVTSVEVFDSGYGYIPNGEVTLERDGFPFIITATSNVLRQGVGEGYWKTTNSHLNSEKKLEDNIYYQEYSYDVLSGLSLNRYEAILKKVLHVSGNELFGSVSKTSKIETQLSVANSVIEIA
jgi:hypothetical protein